MDLLILWTVDKAAPTTTNSELNVSLSILLALISISKPKLNQPLIPIQYNLRSVPSTWPPKWCNESNLSHKTFDFKSLMIQLAYKRTVNLQFST